MSQLAGKVALVTGANKGIGFEAARQLAQQGLNVVIGARDRARGETAAARLREQNMDVHSVTLDVTDATFVAAAAEEIGARFGRLDVLVNNAGVLKDHGTKARDLTPATLAETLDTNLYGVIRVTRAFLPLLRKSGDARIINVSTTWGSLAATAEEGGAAPAYHISKAALNMWTVVLADDWRADDIRVNSISPGWVRTDMGGSEAPRSVEEGAAIITRLATQADPPTGGFFDDAGRIPW
jgi:NAD(P)-dependent dehydrogenase (short-subunit alcohol dehydrogenase family)